MHDAQAGIRHLEVEGEMPRGFDQIRNHLLSQQDAEGGSEPDVDYVYDIPLDTAKLVSGLMERNGTRRRLHGSAPHRVTRPGGASGRLAICR